MKPSSEFNLLQVAIFSLVILVGVLVPSGKYFVVLLLFPFSLIDRNKAIFSLIALFLVRMSNTAFSGSDSILTTSAWILSLAASSRLWIDFFLYNRIVMVRQMRTLFLFVLVVIFLSAFSMSPKISVFKVLSFFYIAGAIIVGITSPSFDKTTAKSWLHASWFSVLLTSLLFLPFPQLGYFRDGQGFQGSLNHPQLLGVFLAPMLAWFITESFRSRLLSFGSLIMLISIISIILITLARTSIISILMAVIILYLFRVGYIKFLITLIKKQKPFLVLLFILLISPLIFKKFQPFISEFIFKSSTSQDLGVAFEESRGFIILQALNNIRDHPVAGIGFGVANSESHEFNIQLDPLTGLPIGAPTEKANLIIAVLEETGIIGLIIFSVFFLSFLRAIANSENVALASAALTSICTNISEMTFFSMGGAGAYTWIICAIAIAQSPAQYRYIKTRWSFLTKTKHHLFSEFKQ